MKEYFVSAHIFNFPYLTPENQIDSVHLTFQSDLTGNELVEEAVLKAFDESKAKGCIPNKEDLSANLHFVHLIALTPLRDVES